MVDHPSTRGTPRPLHPATHGRRPCASRIARLATLAACALAAVASAAGAPAPPRHGPTPGNGATLAGEPTLREVFAAVLEGAPQLAVYSAEIRAREAQAVEAMLLPNPELQTDVEDVGGSGDRRAFEQTEITVVLAQLIELGGKRARRQRVAESRRALAGWDWEVARLDALAAAARAFSTTLAGQERLQLAVELTRLAEQSLRGVEAQLATGGASTIEASQARVAVAATETDQVLARNELDAARALLAGTWGEEVPRFTRVRGRLAAAPPPPFETLLAGLEANPDMARWTAEREASEAVVALERARAVPDVTVGLGGRHFAADGTNALVFGFSVPLPVFDRNQGDIQEAQARVAKVHGQRATARAATHAALARAYADLRTSWQRSEILQARAIPDAERAHAHALAAHRQGLLRFLDVLIAQRALFELRAQHVDALAAHAAATADVARLTGESLHEGASPGGD